MHKVEEMSPVFLEPSMRRSAFSEIHLSQHSSQRPHRQGRNLSSAAAAAAAQDPDGGSGFLTSELVALETQHDAVVFSTVRISGSISPHDLI